MRALSPTRTRAREHTITNIIHARRDAREHPVRARNHHPFRAPNRREWIGSPVPDRHNHRPIVAHAHRARARTRPRTHAHTHTHTPHATPEPTSLSNAGGAGAASPLASTLLASLTARVVTRIAARRFARPPTVVVVARVVAGACARIMEDIIAVVVRREPSRNGAQASATQTRARERRRRHKNQRSLACTRSVCILNLGWPRMESWRR